MTTVTYFLNPLSPWVYMAGRTPYEIAARHGATLDHRPVDTVALFGRTGGTTLAQRHPNRRAWRLQELARWSAKLGVPLNPQPRHFPTNAAPASYAIIAAQGDAGSGGDIAALILGLGAAVWAEERDIAEDGVIRDCLSAAGFDPALADRGLLAGAEAYGRNLEAAVAMGAFGVPTWIVGDQVIWGRDRLEFLDAALAAAA